MKKREFTMNGVAYQSVQELVDKVNSKLTHHAVLFKKSYYPVDYVKMVFETFVPMEQYEFDCDLQPVTCKGILSFVGKGTLNLYDDNGDLLISAVGYRGNDVTMMKDEDKPLDIADACAVAESLVLKRCLKNLGVGADLSIETALSSCTNIKKLTILTKFKETLNNMKGKGNGKKGDSKKNTEDSDRNVSGPIVDEQPNDPNIFKGSVRVISEKTEKEDKVSFWVNITEMGNVLACVSKKGNLARMIGQIKPNLAMEIVANVHVNGKNENVLEVTKITNF